MGHDSWSGGEEGKGKGDGMIGKGSGAGGEGGSSVAQWVPSYSHGKGVGEGYYDQWGQWQQSWKGNDGTAPRQKRSLVKLGNGQSHKEMAQVIGAAQLFVWRMNSTLSTPQTMRVLAALRVPSETPRASFKPFQQTAIPSTSKESRCSF